MDAPDSGDRVVAMVEAASPDLLAYFVRRVDASDDAADLLGEALLVIWRRAASIPSDDQEARMWMFGIARNLLLTHGRSTRRRTKLEDRLRRELRGSLEASSSEGDLGVLGLISRLDGTDQEIIRLTYWDGFTQKQVAQILGMPEGTVRSRHHRARASLRRMFGDASLPTTR